MTSMKQLPNTGRVARSFGRAVQSYDRHARLQRDIADQLAARIMVASAQDILDIGSGTGYCGQRLRPRFPAAGFTNFDLSASMLAYDRRNDADRKQNWVCGDAQSLPFADNTFDLVVSSLTLQWCQAPERFFAGLYRVLKPGGRAWISTLAERTLEELRSSWAEVDDYVHVNSFLSVHELGTAIASAPFASVATENRQVCYHYDSLVDLARELKGIGANNLNAGQASGLTGKRKLQQLRLAFEKHRIAGTGIPVTYDLVFISVEKA